MSTGMRRSRYGPVSARDIRDVWYATARAREARGDAEGAERAREQARTVEFAASAGADVERRRGRRRTAT